MKIGIVITAINLWNRYSKQCIESIKTKHDYRIVFVDNGSTDATKEEASKLVSSSFSHRRYEINVGCQAAWNFGIKDSFDNGCDYVLVLNNDILLHPDAIDLLVDRFETDTTDTLALVSCMDIRGDVTLPAEIFSLSSADKKEVAEAPHPNFSAFMINRRFYELVGEADTGFFPAYFEDNDLHYRMKLLNLDAIVYPPAMFYHFGSRTQNEAFAAPIVPSPLFEKNRAYYVEKWGGLPGEEKYTLPFNDSTRSVKWTKQS